MNFAWGFNLMKFRVYVIGDDLKNPYLLYLQGKLSIEDKQSMIHYYEAYQFENLGRTCFSARDVCKKIDNVDPRLGY